MTFYLLTLTAHLQLSSPQLGTIRVSSTQPCFYPFSSFLFPIPSFFCHPAPIPFASHPLCHARHKSAPSLPTYSLTIHRWEKSFLLPFVYLTFSSLSFVSFLKTHSSRAIHFRQLICFSSFDCPPAACQPATLRSPGCCPAHVAGNRSTSAPVLGT